MYNAKDICFWSSLERSLAFLLQKIIHDLAFNISALNKFSLFIGSPCK